MPAFDGFSFNPDAFFSTVPVYGAVVMPAYSNAFFAAVRIRNSGFYCQATSSSFANAAVVFESSVSVSAVSNSYFSPIRTRLVSFFTSAQSAAAARGVTIMSVSISIDADSSSRFKPSRTTFGDLTPIVCYSGMVANGRYLWERETVQPQSWSDSPVAPQLWSVKLPSAQDWTLK